MNHERARHLLPAFADRQTGAVQRFRLRRHIAGCPSCLAELEAIQAMGLAMRTNLPVHRAPPALAMRIGSAVAREAAAREALGQAAARREVVGREALPHKVVRGDAEPRVGFGIGGFRTAGPALAGGLIGVVLTLAVTRGAAPPDPLIADVVGDHVRSMMADHLTDVATSDRHTVKPWLSARLDLSPVVKDFAAEGYPLVGGRLDYVEGHRAAAIVYRRDKHVINLFAFASGEQPDAPPRQESRDGFNIVRWRMGGLSYVAVSDVEPAQLLGFARLVVKGDG